MSEIREAFLDFIENKFLGFQALSAIIREHFQALSGTFVGHDFA